MIEGGVTHYIRTDDIGRPVFATDGAGNKVWEATYLPFGGVDTSTGAPINLRFPGQWFQSESGLHQNWMRDYDPTTGRYIQADPLGLVDGASVYGYALGNPGRWTDFRGTSIRPSGGIEPLNGSENEFQCGFEEAGLKDVCKKALKSTKGFGRNRLFMLVFCAFVGEEPPGPKPPGPRPPTTTSQPKTPPKLPPKNTPK